MLGAHPLDIAAAVTHGSLIHDWNVRFLNTYCESMGLSDKGQPVYKYPIEVQDDLRVVSTITVTSYGYDLEVVVEVLDLEDIHNITGPAVRTTNSRSSRLRKTDMVSEEVYHNANNMMKEHLKNNANNSNSVSPNSRDLHPDGSGHSV